MRGRRSNDAARKTLRRPKERLGYRLWQVHYLWHKHIERELRALDLTHLQYVLLAAANDLTLAGEIPSQICLSNFTKVEKMMVSKNLRVLERRGYMSRKPHPEDRRANRIELTAAGLRVLQRAFSIGAKSHTAFFRTLGSDWKRLNNILQALMESHAD